MKILYLANLHPNKLGSMEEHALFLSRELRERGSQLFVGFISEPLPEIRQLFENNGAEVLTVYCGDTPFVGNKVYLKFGEVLALRRIVVKNQIDLVHVNFMGVTNPMLFGIYLTKAKIVFTEHSSGSALKRKFFKHFLSWSIHGLISKRIHKYIAVSDFVRDRLKITHHLPDSKILTIYNGVNLDRFCPRDRNEARQKLGLPLDIPIIATVAMLIPQKGIQHAIEAFALIGRKFKDLRLLIVGEGWYKTELESLCTTLRLSDYVSFLGRRSDVHLIIAASDVVVVPSIWDEAFGLIVAETMACGRPVVASKCGGITELIEDSVSGYLVPCGNAEIMARKLNSLLSDSLHRNKLGQQGRKACSWKFNLFSQVKQLVKVYQEALNEK